LVFLYEFRLQFIHFRGTYLAIMASSSHSSRPAAPSPPNVSSLRASNSSSAMMTMSSDILFALKNSGLSIHNSKAKPELHQQLKLAASCVAKTASVNLIPCASRLLTGSPWHFDDDSTPASRVSIYWSRVAVDTFWPACFVRLHSLHWAFFICRQLFYKQIKARICPTVHPMM